MVREILSIIIAYLLGSIPTGYLIVKKKEGIDIREVGSGGTGATNVMRKAGKGAAALTYLIDFSKGSLAVLIAQGITGGDLRWTGAAAVMAIVGNAFPVWLGFRGGKGVATGFGVYLALSPLSVLSALALFIATVYLKRYVSLGSIVATATVPLWMLLYEKWIFARPQEQFIPLIISALISCSLVVTRHRQNIERLLKGTENKLGSGKPQTITQ